MGRPRVLVVATWLPTQKNPSLGAFSQRDIQALSTVADIRVLHVAAPHVDDGARRTWILAGERRIPVLRLPLRPKSVPDMMRIIRAIRAGARWADLVHSMAVSALLPVALARSSAGFSSIVASDVWRVWDFLRGHGQTSRNVHAVDGAWQRAEAVDDATESPAAVDGAWRHGDGVDGRAWSAKVVDSVRHRPAVVDGVWRLGDVVDGGARPADVVDDATERRAAVDNPQHRVAALPWIHTEHWSGFVQDTPVPRAVGLLEALPDRVVAVSGFLADRLRQASHRDIEVVGNIVQVPEPTARHNVQGAIQTNVLPSKSDAYSSQLDAYSSQPDAHSIQPAAHLTWPDAPSSQFVAHTSQVDAQPDVHLIGVGGLIAGKRPLLALQATAALRAQGVNADLTWVGGGELADEMTRQANEAGVPLTLTGAVPPQRVPHFLAQADLLLLPTRVETFCLAAAEALASGRPVVVGARGGQRDFVRPPAGCLVDSDDPHVWAEAVVQTLRTSASMSAEDIAADVRKRFSSDNLARAYRSRYEHVLSLQNVPSGSLQRSTRRSCDMVERGLPVRDVPSGSLQRSTRQSRSAYHQPVMVFHAPFALNEHATSASGIRPVQMRQAFKEAGFTVMDVSGTAQQRRRRIRHLRRFLSEGGQVDFAYSESATLPTVLSGRPGHWPVPVGDVALYAMLRRHRVPTGVFYRDIYWRFPDYRRSVGALAFGTIPLYLLDLAVYRLCHTRVYVPSLEMARYVPWVRRAQFEPLPPGTSIVPSGSLQHATRQEQSLRGLGQDRASVRLLYVGGLGAHYRMHRLVAAVAETLDASLTICTREEAWHSVSGEYQAWVDSADAPLDTQRPTAAPPDNSAVFSEDAAPPTSAPAPVHPADPATNKIRVVHQSGAGLEPLYQLATVASLVVEPEQYRSFAMPFKLFEYLGHGLPILATQGTMAGDFVAEHHIGWTVGYDQDQIKAVLDHLAKHPEEIREAARAVRAVAQQNTWVARACQVATDLRGFSTVFAKRGRFDSRSSLSSFKNSSRKE